MDKETVIQVNGVSKVYNLYNNKSDRFKEAWSFSQKSYHTEHYALDNINFDVHKGECIGIIGTNGSGKSTLLKIITGVLNASKGTVNVNGKISALLELGAGFNMEYTGLKNIYLNGIMMGYTREEMDKKVSGIIEFAEIGDFINQPVKTYSSGMFARLAFAVAINVEPDILIVDEALSVGDIFFQAKCYKKFNEFQEMGKTILFVSHDLSSVLKYCDRCLLINKGKQVMIGDTPAVVNKYRKILVDNSKEQDHEISEEAKILSKGEDDNIKKDSTELWKNELVINNNASDYGDGVAEIVDFALCDNNNSIQNSILKGEEFTIRIKVHFYKDAIKPILAYTIKDLKGQELTGTNTYLEDCMFGDVKAGEERIVEFSQKMTLQAGQYLLCLGCTGYEGDKFVVHHRLYDICNIHVISEHNTIGFVDMFSTVEYR